MLCVVVLRSGYVGSLRGIWVELLGLASVLGAVAIGVNTTTVVARQLATRVPLDMSLIEAVSFFAITLLAWFVLRIVARWIGRAAQQHAMGVWNQAAGILLGLASGALTAGLVAWMLLNVPWGYLHASVTERSLTAPPAIRLIHAVTHHAAISNGGVSASSPFFN